MTAALIFQIIFGITFSKTKDKVWHISIAMFISAIGLVLSPFTSDPSIALLLICLSAMGVWWTISTTFLSGSAGAVGLINSCGNIDVWVSPYMIVFIKTHTNAFDLSYFIMSNFMLMSGCTVLTLKYKVK